MSVPLAFLASLAGPRAGTSLGDHLAEQVTDSRRVSSLLDCLPSTSAPAIFSPDPLRSSLSHRELHDFVGQFALPYSAPHKRLGPNDRVMVVLPTSPENAVALMALATYHTTAPVNASCTASELREDAERLRARAVVTTKEAVERLELFKLCEDLDCDVVLVEARPAGPAGLFDMVLMADESDCSTLGGRSQLDGGWELVPTKPHGMYDYSMVLHTSGTSGKKKGVPYTLRSLIIGTCAVVVSWDLQPHDVNMNMMPLFHVGGIVRNLWAPMFSGGSAIMCAGFDATAFWTLSMELGATWYYAAPTMHHAILSSRPEGIVPARDTRIRMICNAAGGLLPTLALDLKQTFGGAIVLPSYGMTECMPISTPLTTYQLDRPGCSGIACGPYLAIRDPSNIERELPVGQTGAVCVRGLPTFQGYEVGPGLPLDTSAFSSEGWFDSGDCGYMDADGYLYITGRSKEIINKGGEVISPFEIEEAIMTVAKERVKTTLAFSVEHDVLQETIGVVIVGAAAQPRISLAELHDLLRDCLHPSKWPFALVYMDDLPKNNAGKPLRIKLASRLGLGCLTDSVPSLHRHFEAVAPSKDVPLSEPIQCSRVSLDVHAVERAIGGLLGVNEAAVRGHADGSLEAFISVDKASGIDSARIRDALLRVLPGYSLPDPLHTLHKPFAKTGAGAIDFRAMEDEIKAHNASSLSKSALAVRDIVAELLSKEPGLITGDSDFFLLGGNSLLLGRLAYFIRKNTGQNVKVSDLFTNSTINGIAGLIEVQDANMSVTTLGLDPKEEGKMASGSADSLDSYYSPTLGADFDQEDRTRGQTHLWSLIVQAIPIIFFYPLKAALTWSMLLFVLAKMTDFVKASFWERLGSLMFCILVGRITVRVVAPIAAILFKWVVIGRYRPGLYRMWSGYHLRWWIVNQSLRASGKGIFALTPALQRTYWRLLGAKIGSNVHIDPSATLGEADLLTIEDNVRIDKALIRGFCVERDGYCRLDRIRIGRKAIINTFTQIAPGAVIADETVYGPHASSHDEPGFRFFGNYNRTLALEPSVWLKIFIGLPVIGLVKVISYVPWFAAIYGMIRDADVSSSGLSELEAIIHWFASPERVAWHFFARVLRGIGTPLLQVLFGILVKRIMGLNHEGLTSNATQMSLLRRYINSSLLSQHSLKHAFDVLGTHYEATSIVFRLMGAKIGRRVYWPGSGIYCPDPELLEIGDDVVFGSRSELFTTDRIGTQKIIVEAGAMIADRVVLLPGTRVGRKTVMGSGALGRREGVYPAGSTWMGSERGEAICFSRGSKESDNSDTITPFGRAFYTREATFFVFPYALLVFINLIMAAFVAAFWSCGAIAAAQILQQIMIHIPRLPLFKDKWYDLAILYGVISGCFIVVLNVQAWLAITWSIVTKWIVIGPREVGPCPWDKSSYCQRWQLHLTLSRLMHRGYGNGGVLAQITGSAYIVLYFRALGAKIGKNCSIFASGHVGLMTEPDLVSLGNDVNLDNCSVVAHINSRGKFALNQLNISNGCALRSGSRLLSGASMEESSMLLEHTLMASGETAFAGAVYVGWPAREIEPKDDTNVTAGGEGAKLLCGICRDFPQVPSVTSCGHIYCNSCISRVLLERSKCPLCAASTSTRDLRRIHPSLAV